MAKLQVLSTNTEIRILRSRLTMLIKYCTLFIFEISDIDQIKISKDLCVAFLYILDLHKYGRQ